MDPSDAYDQGYEAGKAMERQLLQPEIDALKREVEELRPYYEEYQARWREMREKLAAAVAEPFPF